MQTYSHGEKRDTWTTIAPAATRSTKPAATTIIKDHHVLELQVVAIIRAHII